MNILINQSPDNFLGHKNCNKMLDNMSNVFGFNKDKYIFLFDKNDDSCKTDYTVYFGSEKEVIKFTFKNQNMQKYIIDIFHKSNISSIKFEIENIDHCFEKFIKYEVKIVFANQEHLDFNDKADIEQWEELVSTYNSVFNQGEE